MGWQRFNRTTNVFEVSDNNGASWETLVIAAAGVNVPVPPPFVPTKANLPASIAYEDEANVFTQYQSFRASGGTSYGGAPIEIQSAYPRVAFHWPGVAASQIGIDSAANVRTYDNPGTGYAPFACGTFTAVGHIMNNGGYIYPGQVNGGAVQGQWYLGSHGAYGLYSNTGFYLEAGVYTNLVEARSYMRSAAGVYDYARGNPMGMNIGAGVDTYCSTPHLPKAGNFCYARWGNTMYINTYFAGTVNGGAPHIGYYQIILPEGAIVGQTGGSPYMTYDGAGWGAGLANWTVGDNHIKLHGSNLRGFDGGQIIYVYCGFCVPAN